MAIYKDGLLGPYRGKIGPVVGSNWRNIDVSRSLPRKTNTPASEKQLAQRLKFKLAIDFLLGIKDVIKINSKGNAATSKTDLNAATKIIINKMEGVYPDFKIPYPEAVFSKGSLMNILPVVTLPDTETINISWSPRLGLGASEHDVVNVILYIESTESFLLYDTAKRKDASFSYHVEEVGVGLIHIWTFVSTADGTDRSDSKYCGNATF